MKLSVVQAIKLASVAVHVEEMLSSDGHEFDAAALRSLLIDRDVRAVLDNPSYAALLPLKRVARVLPRPGTAPAPEKP